MATALSVYTGSAGFAPSVRASPSSAVATMEAFVAEKRGQGASWSAVAGMVGVSEHTLRRTFDKAYAPPPGLERVKPIAANGEPVGAFAPGTCPVTTGDVVRLLAKGPADFEALCAATGADARAVSDILNNGRRRGLFSAARVKGRRGADWTLTASGRMHRAAADGGRRAVSKVQLLSALRAGPMTVAELAEATGGRGSTCATYISTLRERGLVSAASDGRNGRLRYSLTEEGARVALAGGVNG
jgi:DNA-binding transcriptional ArsR family regulator